MKYKWLLLFPFILSACSDFGYSGEGNDVPTAGEVHLLSDYGDTFMVNEAVEMFHADYPRAKIQMHFLCENEMLRLLESDSFQAAITNRNLTTLERENLEKLGKKVRSYRIATTSIAVIVSKNNPAASVSEAELKSLMADQNHSIKVSAFTQVIFDESCGSVLTWFREHWFRGELPEGRIKQAGSPGKLIEAVASDPEAVGLVSVNWLADRMDLESRRLASRVKVLPVLATGTGKAVLPFQSQMAGKQYPFVQEVYIHDLQGYTGLVQGFTAFLGSQPGQLIIKKSGLLPAHDMGRTIELVEER